ncbi:hypothetical protein [Nesterenkonia pannonica]|uniref:hypothetical protein n=1 Tax=Nesterenkonia pannonica TaxID=1548602 RepID=UPI0021642F53|nr:hypothetical protein [Nesterenkonia pannonica]
MPGQYITRHEPPKLRDRFYSDSLGISIAVGSLIISALLLPAVAPEFIISRALEGLPWWVLVMLSITMAVGATRFLHAAITPRKAWSKKDIMRVKYGGAFAFSCAWLGYCISVLSTGNPNAIVTIVMSSSIAIGYAGQARGLYLSERILNAREEAEKFTEG